MKNITKISPAKFKVSTPEIPNSQLELDFNPIIEEFNLKGNFTLIHWQAKPKGVREWGIYTSGNDSYRSVEQWQINSGSISSLQLDDKTATTVPSAVLFIGEDRITCINQKVIIGDVFLRDVS